jgi:hypothetical protein
VGNTLAYYNKAKVTAIKCDALVFKMCSSIVVRIEILGTKKLETVLNEENINYLLFFTSY